MKSIFLCFFSLWPFLFFSCSPDRRDNVLYQILEENREKFGSVLSRPENYRVQIIYTQINRDENNEPSFLNFRYRVNEEEYFYPASMVKLPVAALAMERINELDIEGLSIRSAMVTDSTFTGQTKVTYDSSAQNNQPSVAHYIKKIFLVSDNDAFNRLYEFLGQEYINRKLHEKGYENARITHRLSIPLSIEENKHTNPVRFYNQRDELLYRKPALFSSNSYISHGPILLGEGYQSGDSIINRPMDFSAKNFIPLEELHTMLKALVFPDHTQPVHRFALREEDYAFLYKYMSMFPRECEFPYYGDKYEDNYCKFLMFADLSGPIPDNIRIFNKIGLAYGFLIESAYIIDLEKNIEFMLSAVISVNDNLIYNDGVYEYDSVGFPFMGNLGRVIYDYEKKRIRKNQPDLSRFNLEYE